MEAIQALKRARSTVVVITHKTAMLAAVDKLLVLAAGRVSAFGGRLEVLSRLMGCRNRGGRQWCNSRPILVI